MNLLDNTWLAKLTSLKKIVVGFSGGLDSSVLLHVLSRDKELRSKILAIHVNHTISNNADIWQEHCLKVCKELQIDLKIVKVNLNCRANIEEQARNARYQAFSQALSVNDCLLLAHHQNDQAETVLFNILRGSGVNGISGIPKQRKLGQGYVLRPLLDYKRSELLAYAKLHNLHWIEDESNADLNFSRNYLRREVIPLILTKWPSAIDNIHTCANNLTSARANLLDLALLDCPDLFSIPNELNLEGVTNLKQDRLINVLRTWFDYNHVLSPNAQMYVRIINEVINAGTDKIPKFCFGTFVLRRYKDSLYLVTENIVKPFSLHWKNFPDPLYLEDGKVIYAQEDKNGVAITAPNNLWIRTRQGGELIKYNGQTKKLKKLLQELRVLPWQREQLPLLFENNILQAVIGLVCADNYQDDNEAIKYKFKMSD